MGEKIVTVVAFMGGLALVGLNLYELGRDSGKREAIAAMKCYTNSAYSIIDNRTGKCAERKGKKG